MKAAVLVFPGSNREGDVAQAIELVTGRKPQMVWHGDGDFEKTDLIVVPGGFSYGDYLRCGAMAAQSPVMAEIKKRAAQGVPVLAICNGGQIAFRYCAPDGTVNGSGNPNGSIRNIAGVFNETKTVMGLMPHPENAVEPMFGGSDG